MVSGGDLRVGPEVLPLFLGAGPEDPKVGTPAKVPAESPGFWRALLSRLVGGGLEVATAVSAPAVYVRRELHPGECGKVGIASAIIVCQ